MWCVAETSLRRNSSILLAVGGNCLRFCVPSFGFHPFCSVSSGFPGFLFPVPLRPFFTFRQLLLFPLVQTNPRQTNHNDASIS
jgi:hypothetical protein